MEGMGDREALWKLGGLGASATNLSAQPNGDPALARDAVASLPGDPALVPIFQAISEKQAITFDYRGTERHVEPWRLDFHRGRWYLTGYDRIREGERNFRLDRIDDGVQLSGAAAESVPQSTGLVDGPRRAWEMGGEDQVIAKLLVDQSRVESAAKQLGPNVEHKAQADGSVIFTVPVVRYDAFRAFVLGFLEHAELLEPDEWRQDIIDWLSSLASQDGEQ